MFQLLDFTEVKRCKKDDFILFESLPVARDPAKDRKLILIKPTSGEQSTFTIGRDNKNDIVIAEQSISREQAKLAFREGDGFYLSDQHSKFGTSVQIQGKKYISDPQSAKSSVCVQVGKTVM